MRRVVALAVVLSAVLVATAGSRAATRTSLTVTYWASGAGKHATWTLRCGPAGGTVPEPRVACARLASGGRRLFAPVPKNAVCAQIYGGPQVALVVGVVQGRRVWARFARRDGCEIARWNRLSPWLLPGARAR